MPTNQWQSDAININSNSPYEAWPLALADLEALRVNFKGSGRPATADLTAGQTYLDDAYAANTWAIYVVVDPATAGLDALFATIDITTGYVTLVSGGVALSLIAQAEAEAGTGTTPRLWSALRVKQAIAANPRLPHGYISGLLCTNNAIDAVNDIDISAGECRDSTSTVSLFGSAMTKRLDAAWAAGTNQGGLDTGTKAVSTEYYLHAILKDADNSVDYLFSASRTAPTMPTGYTYFRNIGWCKTDGSGSIIAFTISETGGGGIHFQWASAISDVTLSNTLSTTPRTDAISVPTGIKVFANIHAVIYDASAAAKATIYDPDTSRTVNESNLYSIPSRDDQQQLRIMTNASRQIGAIGSISTVDTYGVHTLGFEWGRR